MKRIEEERKRIVRDGKEGKEGDASFVSRSTARSIYLVDLKANEWWRISAIGVSRTFLVRHLSRSFHGTRIFVSQRYRHFPTLNTIHSVLCTCLIPYRETHREDRDIGIGIGRYASRTDARTHAFLFFLYSSFAFYFCLF